MGRGGKVWEAYIEQIMNEEDDWDHNQEGMQQKVQ